MKNTLLGFTVVMGIVAFGALLYGIAIGLRAIWEPLVPIVFGGFMVLLVSYLIGLIAFGDHPKKHI